MRNLLLRLTLASCFVAINATPAHGPLQPSRASLVGCWKLAPSRFAVVDKPPADSAQTVLPTVIRMDTLPGTSWNGDPIGRRVREVANGSRPYYDIGYYRFFAPDRVQIDWSASGDIGMTLDLRFDRSTLRGSATAWTDYGGEERSSITLSRVACARSSSFLETGA